MLSRRIKDIINEDYANESILDEVLTSNPDIQDKQNWNKLAPIINMGFKTDNDALACIKKLLAIGVPANFEFNDLVSPSGHVALRSCRFSLLGLAAEFGCAHTVEFLLAQGAEVTLVNNDFGSTPLHLAMNRCHPKIIFALLNKAPGLINASNDHNLTPLEWLLIRINTVQFDYGGIYIKPCGLPKYGIDYKDYCERHKRDFIENEVDAEYHNFKTVITYLLNNGPKPEHYNHYYRSDCHNPDSILKALEANKEKNMEFLSKLKKLLAQVKNSFKENDITSLSTIIESHPYSSSDEIYAKWYQTKTLLLVDLIDHRDTFSFKKWVGTKTDTYKTLIDYFGYTVLNKSLIKEAPQTQLSDLAQNKKSHIHKLPNELVCHVQKFLIFNEKKQCAAADQITQEKEEFTPKY